ncbi:MAG: CDP-alcohol phosphatidyltransferase family protein [Candidatus Saccharibacteria bacterium]
MPEMYDASDPPVVREVKALLWAVAAVLLGWWLQYIKYRWPRSKSIVNQVPNAMSVFRIPVSPVVAVMLSISIWEGNTTAAWWWFVAVVGLIILDGLDGPLARQLDAVSDFGKAIDPAADKVLILSLAIAYSVLVMHFQGLGVFIPLVVALSWAIWVEIKLVMIARDTDRLVKLLGNVDLPGANVFGKIKFSIQALSFLLAYALMITMPADPVGGLWLTVSMIVARFFADKSLGRHRQDVWEFENLARHRHLPVPAATTVRELVLLPFTRKEKSTESGQSAA